MLLKTQIETAQEQWVDRSIQYERNEEVKTWCDANYDIVLLWFAYWDGSIGHGTLFRIFFLLPLLLLEEEETVCSSRCWWFPQYKFPPVGLCRQKRPFRFMYARHRSQFSGGWGGPISSCLLLLHLTARQMELLIVVVMLVIVGSKCSRFPAPCASSDEQEVGNTV